MRALQIGSLLATMSIVSLAGGCSSPSSQPTSPHPLTLGTACSSLDAEQTVVEGGAEPPMCAGDEWIFALPATTEPPTPRRSEVLLTHDGQKVSGGEGDVIAHEVELSTRLGSAGASDDDWHVVWQLHGPTDGEWRPPPVGLRIRHGQLAVSGGAGWPGHDWNTANHEWMRPLAQIEDGQTYRIRVLTHLSSDPEKAWISATVDGRAIVDRWQPRAEAGFPVGTLYPGQEEVTSRIGLYRGTQGAPPPEYTQVVSQRVLESRRLDATGTHGK